ncbi:hypothetical protein HF521_011810 [Silurus meridionalis]|uniref:Uncharacterized protein n=1 Tax=Silurus meridionalis TaxID=175797 RepID=A0A8T0AH01_SILME|nr:hypothetical protein HF521_011810 [Silurus meridionalis]
MEEHKNTPLERWTEDMAKTKPSVRDEKSTHLKKSKLQRKSEMDEAENSREAKSRRAVKRPWCPNEVNAVIAKGHLTTKADCEQCKTAEDPVLRERTVQNIRDLAV